MRVERCSRLCRPRRQPMQRTSPPRYSRPRAGGGVVVVVTYELQSAVHMKPCSLLDCLGTGIGTGSSLKRDRRNGWIGRCVVPVATRSAVISPRTGARVRPWPLSPVRNTRPSGPAEFSMIGRPSSDISIRPAHTRSTRLEAVSGKIPPIARWAASSCAVSGRGDWPMGTVAVPSRVR